MLDGARVACKFCGATAIASGVGGAMSVVIERVGPSTIAVIKCVRGFTGLGLAEANRAIGSLPATFSVSSSKVAPAAVLKELTDLGCVARIVVAPAVLPSDPASAAHQGAWGFRVEVAGHRTIDAIKLVREVADLGLAEAKQALEAPRVLIPIATRAPHEEIRRRFAALGYTIAFEPSGG
ncbi:MAG: ribosomal protein L7/L12 [Labilithrix sp.]|nr:ribosomal protein L7/L12 [Labilithrix sp.]